MPHSGPEPLHSFGAEVSARETDHRGPPSTVGAQHKSDATATATAQARPKPGLGPAGPRRDPGWGPGSANNEETAEPDIGADRFLGRRNHSQLEKRTIRSWRLGGLSNRERQETGATQ